MTLRVRLEIVPYGDETFAREIGRLNIHNVGEGEDGACAYRVDGHGTVLHKHESGAWRLVMKAIKDLCIAGPANALGK